MTPKEIAMAKLGLNADELDWRTATRSGGGNCVEVAPCHGMVAVRNSREPLGLILLYTADEWTAFIDGAKRGEFDHLATRAPA
jgi:hypothetical protein